MKKSFNVMINCWLQDWFLSRIEKLHLVRGERSCTFYDPIVTDKLIGILYEISCNRLAFVFINILITLMRTRYGKRNFKRMIEVGIVKVVDDSYIPRTKEPLDPDEEYDVIIDSAM